MKKLALIVLVSCLLATISFASEAKLQNEVKEFIPRPAKGVDVFQTPNPLVEQMRQARRNGDTQTYLDLVEEWKNELPVQEKDGDHPVVGTVDNPQMSPLLRWGNDIILYNGDVYYDTWVDNEEEPISVVHHKGDTLRAAVACPDSLIRFFISTDKGLNWTYLNHLYFTGYMGYEPEIVCGPDGNYWHMLSRWSSNSGDLWCHNWDIPGGTSAGAWVEHGADQVMNYTLTSDRCEFDWNYVLYVAMHCYAGGADADSVSFTRSFDAGVTWAPPTGLLFNGCGVPNLSYGYGDWLYMAYWTDQTGEYYINTKRSDNLGNTWFTSLIMFHDTTTKQGPQIAAAHDGSGDVWLMFPRRDPGSTYNDYGMLWQWSQNNGANWSGLGYVNSWYDYNEVFPSMDIYDGYNSNSWYPYITFIRSYHDWTNPVVYCYNWQTDSTWSPATSFNDSVPEFVRPVQTWEAPEIPAMAYVGEGGVNVYYDGWAVGAVEEEKEPPVSNQLTIKTHPNPFSKTTRIQYSLPSRGIVSVHAYNILGQRVATLFDGVQESGNHYLQWNGVGNNGSKLPKGVYFLRIKTQNAEKRTKLTFIR